jgi:cysteine desulfurase
MGDNKNRDTEIYMDHIAASPVRKEAADRMAELLRDGFGNPQSIHGRGQAAAEVLASAREQVAALVGAEPWDVIFTATGSEANNLALKGVAPARKKKSNRIVVSAVEHLSVLNPAKTLAKDGYELVVLPVDSYGLVSPEGLEAELAKGAAIVSIMHANNEIGTIEPIEQLAAAARKADVPFHSDGWGTAGVIPIEMKKLGVSALSIAAQNFGGPPGAAALVLPKGTPTRAVIEGGIQERGLRAGQENIPAIAGMGVAAELAAKELEANAAHTRRICAALVERLPKEIPEVIATGHPERRLPNHASFCVKYIEGEGMLLFLNQMGIMAASGSACTSKALKGSYVLEAIGVPTEVAQGSLVFTMGPENRLEDVDRIVSVLKPVVARLREMSPIYNKRK